MQANYNVPMSDDRRALVRAVLQQVSLCRIRCCIAILFLILRALVAAGGLGQCLQDGMDLFRDCHQHKLELLPGGHQSGTLIAQMFQRGRNIDLTGALVHATQHEIEQNVRTGAPPAAYLLWTTIGHERPRYDLFTLRLKSSSALADVGTPPCGQDRKWNCVTVRVSPVRRFFR
uniref:Uncharacterized protein n=1 Tax=Anopheles culicifacies TaxID=139723 RepID=A0A182MRN5_9DIPT